MGNKVDNKYQSTFRFADDIILFTKTTGKMKTMILKLNRDSCSGILKMNTNRIKSC